VRTVVYVTGQEPSWYTDTYATVKAAFNTTAGYKSATTLLVGVDHAASQSFTPYCSAKSAKNALDGEHLDLKYGLCGINFGGLLGRSDCRPEFLAQSQADAIVEFVTTAALEETLLGKDPGAVWSGFDPQWGELTEQRVP
jgi:hypothetical protein